MKFMLLFLHILYGKLISLFFFLKKRLLYSLSFIAFSLGGVITRAALSYLWKLKHKFMTFITLGSPHLGYVYNTSKLIETGFCFLIFDKNFFNRNVIS